MGSKIPCVISIIMVLSVTCLYALNRIIANSDFIKNTPEEYNWISHGLMNVFSYLTLLLPGYLTYRYIQKVNYLSLSGNNICLRAVRFCFGDNEFVSHHHPSTPHQKSTYEDFLSILFHFVGLQISYLTWGVLQEKVMTQNYTNGEFSAHFTDSQFLVFVNRVLAVFMSGLFLLYRRYTQHQCPFYKFTFCSLSNILSSWCQYEALKYVSFPHQVLAKAAKPIPVMLMGKIISQTKYEYYEYVTSVVLSLGMLLFMLDAGNDRATSTVTTVSGALLLLLYITFDSFTSNWQGSLFKTYSIKPIQMMCFVNFFSCIFTLVSLIQQDNFRTSFSFMFRFPQFFFDCIVLSICSASGQLFIFSTISKFGPLVFAIITTIRQGFSVLLSCIIYNHHISVTGMSGVILVFVSVFLRIYCGYRMKKVKKSAGPKTMILV